MAGLPALTCGVGIPIMRVSLGPSGLGDYAFGKRSVAQSGSAPGLGPGGRGFESLHSDQPIVQTCACSSSG